MIKIKKMKVRFYIIGDGRAKKELQEKVIQEKVEDNIKFIDKKPATEIPKYYGACNMAFLSLKSDRLSNQILPAKLQSYLACGIPILGCVGGEAEEIIEKSRSGFCVKCDAEEITKTIEGIMQMDPAEFKNMKKNAIEFFKNNYEKDLLLNKMDQYLFEGGK